ncbi:hypothetical protein [Spirillospora albida]|uniref:hypothetical protein n=1 Tax=Spirillospora albida TaxID=58123 RepID=UPI0004BF75F8|nr:hypothetical protein [Spirillospora albida]
MKSFQVVRGFPPDEWTSMSLDEYALGTPVSKESFCYRMEFGTPALCSMRGGSAAKHIISETIALHHRDGIAARVTVLAVNVPDCLDHITAGEPPALLAELGRLLLDPLEL